jgi:hypothetical protein
MDHVIPRSSTMPPNLAVRALKKFDHIPDLTMSLTSKRGHDDNSNGDVLPETDRSKRQRVNTTTLQSCDLSALPVHAIRSISAAPTSPKSSDSPQQFEYPESEIKLLRVIGSGDHAIVYRVCAGDKTFAIKVVSRFASAFGLPLLEESNSLRLA